MRIAVIGGGISGLAAAHRVRELLPQAEMVVFEASHRLGGVLETNVRDGFLVERSADSFITRLPWAVDLCDRLGIADQLLPTNETRRRAQVVCNGELLPVPDGFVLMTPGRVWPIITSRILSWRGKLKLLAEPLKPRRRTPDAGDFAGSSTADDSIASFATRRLGREAYERLVQPLLAGIYTGDAEKLSMAATLPELLAQEKLHGRLVRDKSRPSESGARYGLFVAPQNGMGSLVQAIVDRLPAGAIQLDTPVSKIARREGSGWIVTLDGGHIDSFDAVIVALPAPAAARLLSGCDPVLATELAAIEYAGCAVISLAYRRNQLSRPLEGFGFVVPQIEGRPILAASFASEKFPGRAPDGSVVVRVFFGGTFDPSSIELPADELKRVAHQELMPLLRINGAPQWADVARWPNSMPQYHVGHVARVMQIEARAATHAGLALAGNAYHGVGIPQCIHSGELAAERAIASLTNVAAR